MSDKIKQLETSPFINKETMEIRYQTFIDKVKAIYEKEKYITDLLPKLAEKCHICRTSPTVLFNMGAYEKKAHKIKLTDAIDGVTPKKLIAAVNKYKRRSRINVEFKKNKAEKAIADSNKNGQTSFF